MDREFRLSQGFPVLRHAFDSSRLPRIEALGNHGGFSGARLFRVNLPGSPLLLKVWPADRTRQELESIHRLMRYARKAGLDFVPAVLPACQGTIHEQEGCPVDLTTWQPGRADFWSHPRPQRIRAAAVALARLHQVWNAGAGGSRPVPAVRRRLDALARWRRTTGTGLGLPEWFAPAHRLVEHWFDACWALLERWKDRPLPVQPCLCDLWHDHVLFTGDNVTGIVDYGSVKVDHVAVDLARMLGSLAEDDRELWRVGLEAYQEGCPLSAVEEELIHVLDRTGILAALCNWMGWVQEGRPLANQTAAMERVMRLIRRVERWTRLLESDVVA